MSIPNVPPAPLGQPRSPIATALLLIVGLLLLAPGVCSVIFIREAVRMHSLYPDRLPAGAYVNYGLWPLWLICFIISAGGIALIVYAFRARRPLPRTLVAFFGVILLLPGVYTLTVIPGYISLIATGGLAGLDPIGLALLFGVCFLSAAGGALLLYKALRKQPAP